MKNSAPDECLEASKPVSGIDPWVCSFRMIGWNIAFLSRQQATTETVCDGKALNEVNAQLESAVQRILEPRD